MIKKKRKTVFFTILVLSVMLASPLTASAKKVKRVVDSPMPQAHAEELNPEYNCEYKVPEKPLYNARFLVVRRKAFVAKKEAFEVKVFIQNTGNVPWFSSDSGCKGPVVNLGTEKSRDRASIFFTDGLFWQSNWLGENRIKMESKRVDPMESAQFTFWSQAPDADGLFREYFEPLVEGVSWMDGGLFHTDIKVGEPDIKIEDRTWYDYIDRSTNLAEVDLSGEKNIEVDLSEQKMYLKIGEYVIRKFPVSTGKARTPTPVGTTKIIEKREVRVAAGRPHWIMPKWMMFRKGGYGIHALPSLANDGGVYWREALSHIGSPRSHGCIRLLPKDAEYVYNFGEVGTKVVVHR